MSTQKPVKLSKTAAKRLGEQLAISLHKYVLPEHRGAIISAKEDIFYDLLHCDSRLIASEAYLNKLDELEPVK